MPLRMAIDAGPVEPRDVALVGARSLDPPELEFMAANGIDDDVDRAVAGADAVYVAFDVDVLAPGGVRCVHAGAGRADRRRGVRRSSRRSPRPACPLVGLGFSGTVPDSDAAALERLAAARSGCNRRDPAGVYTPEHVGACPDQRLDRAQACRSCAATGQARIRTPARSVARTTATTSSRSICGSARSAATTSR